MHFHGNSSFGDNVTLLKWPQAFHFIRGTSAISLFNRISAECTWGSSAITQVEPGPWNGHATARRCFHQYSRSGEGDVCEEGGGQVSGYHRVNQHGPVDADAREAAWNQSGRMPLSPCGLRFKLEPMYAVTKMDIVSFMQEVGNYCPSPLYTLLLTDKWCKQTCVLQTPLLQTHQPPSSRQGQIQPATSGHLNDTPLLSKPLARCEPSSNINTQRQFLPK